MIRIAIRAAEFAVISATLPLGTVGVEPETDPYGDEALEG
jgi:hypothetical protein